MGVVSVWDRFYAKVAVEASVRVAKLGTPCHWWIAGRSRGGLHWSLRKKGGKKRLGKPYGSFRADGRIHRAHVWLWKQLKGPIPDGYEIDHLCNNSLCVNILHLEPKPGPKNAAKANRERAARERAA